MKKILTLMAAIALLSVGMAGAAGIEGSASDALPQPEAVTDWNLPALFTLDNLDWQPGTGSFEGTEIAIVGKDPETGAMALFMKVPQRTLSESHGGRKHFHSSLSHTIVLDGAIAAMIGGERVTMTNGDYFRAPAGLEAVSTEAPRPTLLFMVTDGEFELVMSDEEEEGGNE